MDKGQHLRLFLTDQSTDKVIAMSTELSIHGSAQTENSTTKDTTDAAGVVWDEYDVLNRSVDINFTALVAAGTDEDAKTFADMVDGVTDTAVGFKVAMASGTNNRTIGTVICRGNGKITQISATGQVGQRTTYSGTIKNYGQVSTEKGSVPISAPEQTSVGNG